MSRDAVEFPGLIWVKDPIDLSSEMPTGEAPRLRHHEGCSHFYRAPDGRLLGPPPYRASEDQMRSLPACKTCAETLSGGTYENRDKPGGRRGDICPDCFMERPVAGLCPNCGE